MDPEKRKAFLAINFKSGKQQEALQLAIAGEESAVCILPTGVGKSTIVLATAHANPAKVLLVIFPQVALQLDMLRRLRESGIRACTWDGRLQDSAVQVVTLQVENMKNKMQYRSYVNGLCNRQKLHAIFFDEAHTVVAAASYRFGMYAIRDRLRPSIRPHPGHPEPPVLAMTATCPPPVFKVMVDRLDLSRAALRCIRESSARNELKYVWKTTTATRRTTEIVKIFNKLLRTVLSDKSTHNSDVVLR